MTARYAAWPSPIGASDVAVAGIRLSGPTLVHTDSGDEVWWAEARPTDLVGRLNADAEVHGILGQLPLPKQIDEAAVIHAISPAKES